MTKHKSFSSSMFSLSGRKNWHVKLGEKLLHPFSSYRSYKEPLKNYGHSYEHQSNIGTNGKDF